MGQRFVIPDIHGCSKTFKALVEKISLTKTDTLFLLGDYIDRGPDNCGVIDFILKLQSEGFDIQPLRGNHEHQLLEVYGEYDAATFKFYLKRFKSIDLMSEGGGIKEPYLNFMNQLPFYLELPDYYLVHGGINFDKDNPFEDKNSLLVTRKQVYNAQKAGNRKIVFGHQPTYLEDIKQAIESGSPLIPLDNGCIYKYPHKIFDHTKMGNLLCLNLDNFVLFAQPNIDL